MGSEQGAGPRRFVNIEFFFTMPSVEPSLFPNPYIIVPSSFFPAGYIHHLYLYSETLVISCAVVCPDTQVISVDQFSFSVITVYDAEAIKIRPVAALCPASENALAGSGHKAAPAPSR